MIAALAWAARRLPRPREPGDAVVDDPDNPDSHDAQLLSFTAAILACVVTSPTGWVMSFVWALPIAPLVWAAVARRRLRAPLLPALGAAWVACALSPLLSGWAAVSGLALVVVAAYAADAGPEATMIAPPPDVALLAAIARGIDRMVERPDESRATRVTRMLLWGTGALVVVEAGLGAVGLLRAIRPLRRAGGAGDRDHRAGLAAPAARARDARAALAGRRRVRRRAAGRRRCSRSWVGWHRTTFLYDTLSYHLHVPATWMHDERISIVPAVFGDPSSAYAPSNLELVFRCC